MWIYISLFILLVIVSSSQADPDHFIVSPINTLLYARIDPIVNKGEASAHVHKIIGGSCFSQNPSTPEEQQACDCTTNVIEADKSNYWAPALYYQFPNGSFAPMYGGTRVYYFTKTKDVKPFPPGLRMISGMANLRNTSDPKTLGVRISCNHGEMSMFLPNGTSHPAGCTHTTTGVYFPSCGLANGTLDSEDHFSHMAWPQTHPGGGMPPFDDVNGVHCPDSHPIKYPTMFMEITWLSSPNHPWHSGNPFILATGDQSGLGYHADFVAGWDNKVLSDVIEQCGLGNGPEDALEQCAPLAASYNKTAAEGCRYQHMIPNEDLGFYRPIDKLPGCNPVWPTDGSDSKPKCSEPPTPPTFAYPDVELVNEHLVEYLPMAFTLASNLTNMRTKYIPSDQYGSGTYMRRWGRDGTDAATLESSTVDQLLGVDGKKPKPSQTATSKHTQKTKQPRPASGSVRRHLARRSRRASLKQP